MSSLAIRNFIFVIVSVIGIFFASCSGKTKTLAEMKEYEGPLKSMRNVVNLFSDSAIVKIRLSAPLQLEMKNGDQSFPKGLKVEFFEKDGTISSIMTANKGINYKAKNLFTATGNVVVNQILKGETLNTEELHWNRNERQIFTEKFVTITTEDELLNGTGLTASEDLSTYKITDPQGNFLLNEGEDSVTEEE
jgi:LPS export ABC transporter protein LptC